MGICGRFAIIIWDTGGLVGSLIKEVGMRTNVNVPAIMKESVQGREVRGFTIEIPNKELGSWGQVIKLMEDDRDYGICAHACMLILMTTSPSIYVGDNQHHVPRETYTN